MVYTCVYKDAIIPQTEDGFYTFYKGRVIWNSKEALYKFMSKMSFTKSDYRIYEIDAVWEIDTIESHSQQWNKLKKNCKGKRI